MNKDQLLARVMPAIIDCLRKAVEEIPDEHSWYLVEQGTQHFMREVGQRFLQAVGEKKAVDGKDPVARVHSVAASNAIMISNLP